MRDHIVLGLGRLLADPGPSDGGEFTPVTVSPGLAGFFAMFILAVLVVLLAVDMTRRTRRIQARARVQERMEAEARAAEQTRPADGSEVAGAEPGAEGHGSGTHADEAPGAHRAPGPVDPQRDAAEADEPDAPGTHDPGTDDEGTDAR